MKYYAAVHSKIYHFRVKRKKKKREKGQRGRRVVRHAAAWECGDLIMATFCYTCTRAHVHAVSPYRQEHVLFDGTRNRPISTMAILAAFHSFDIPRRDVALILRGWSAGHFYRNTLHRAPHKFIINEQSITPGFVAPVRRDGIIAPLSISLPGAGNYDINNKYLCKRMPLHVKSAFAICI